jgi:hypothetical protein
VHDAPTHRGRLSYEVRWAGGTPVLRWSCERPGVRLRAPGIDPSWATTDQQGEVRLAAAVAS